MAARAELADRMRDLLWDVQDAVAHLEAVSLEQAHALAASLREMAVEHAAILASPTPDGVDAARRAIERSCQESGALRQEARTRYRAGKPGPTLDVLAVAGSGKRDAS